MSISQKTLKQFIHYNPFSGVFTRLVASSNSVKVGDVASGGHCKGYMRISVNGKRFLSHRLAWLYIYGEMPNQIDHINHDKKDNRISNLRSVTNQENHKNMTLLKSNTSGVAGVSWFWQRAKWTARIKHNGKLVNLGYFDSLLDAICARKSAERAHGFHVNHGV